MTEVIWRPDPQQAARSRMTAFRSWLRERAIVDAADYDALWRWSTAQPGAFWGALADHFDVAFHDQPTTPLADATMPGTRWFPGATLNYAEHALRPGPGKNDDDLAVLFRREDGRTERLSYGELRRQVAATRAAFAALGVGRGDRVAALVPNFPEALVAFLATASLGAIWSSCSPDFGVRAVADRFTQIAPTLLVVVDGYFYNGKRIDVTPTVEALRDELPGLRATIVVPYLGTDIAGTPGPNAPLAWPQLLADHDGAALDFAAVPFGHPLWVLYSSGTTGLPKGIVHGHGGIVLEHLKSLALHFDAGPGDRFFWFTTTGWMMWNFLASSLLVGATAVLYDGSPAHPDLGALWRLAEEFELTVFGTSAPFVQACMKAGVEPPDLRSLRVLGSTGAPLSVDGFRWLSTQLGPRVQIASFSGGTDLCTGFLGPAPDVPVWLGELSRPALGAAIAAYDEAGHSVVDQVGELVITAPMPSMPVSFWNDDDGVRMHAAYFDHYPGVWRHGDWVTITAHGSAIIHGRSDSTLNRGGVRMGTAEFYRIVEAHPGVADSLVIDTSGDPRRGTEGELLCFVVLAPGADLAAVERDLRSTLRTDLSPRHVPDRFVAIDEVPRTLNGKKCEVPVKRILAGVDPAVAVSREALQNPDALTPFIRTQR